MSPQDERQIRKILNPSDVEFDRAETVVGYYIDDPKTGWDTDRYDRVQKILNDWQLRLFANARHAADDAEKSS